MSKSFSENKKSENKALPFPVIGVGASAGGLEALQEFFEQMPTSPGAAFVVVQHLSPDYKSLMDELLARYTKMTIHRVEDGMQIEENHIYLIPPRKNMTIFHGKLLLTEQQYTRSLNLPIDVFLKSLATDQEKNAIGIILSGTGSDGALGIRAIKENGGIAMVQDDRSAKFDGMPRSSISTGMVDFILPPAKLAEEVVNYVKHPFVKKKEEMEQLIGSDENQLLKVISIVRNAKNIDFSEYKDSTIIRRLEKRISLNRFTTLEEYIRFLSNNTKEINTLFNDFLIGVTRFFRDETAFDKLASDVIPHLLKSSNGKKELRLWVVGCSTGEEAYSMAILIREQMEKKESYKNVKIFATDIDGQALDYAGNGLYPESIASEVSPERISKYFVKKQRGYQVNDTIRSMIIFARHNILQDPPFSKIDLLSCRNLLIYLKSPLQQKVLSLFYLSLVQNGFMFLGSSESLGNMADGFQIIDNKHKIYRQQKGFKPHVYQKYGPPSFQTRSLENRNLHAIGRTHSPKANLFDGVFNEILNNYIPPSVIIDEDMEVIHTINDVTKFLKIPTGKISFSLLKLLPNDLSLIVSNLVRRADKNDREVTIENIDFFNSDKRLLTVSAKVLSDPKTGENYFIVSFKEKEKSGKAEAINVSSIDVNTQYQERIDELERELQFKSESLQATVEELETSNEELQSSNEELIASNEELQSTNEELQSVNEELYTVNSEHIKKIEELTQLNADIDNLFKNTRIGTLYLDRSLTIRKVNEVASKLSDVINSDLGRPIQHLSFKNLYDDFVDDIFKVADNLQPLEREIKGKDKEWYSIRVIPYRTAENAVDGILVVFINISNLKKAKQNLSELSGRLQMAMEFGKISWWEWNYQTNVVRSGKLKYENLGYKKDEIEDGFQGWTKLIHPEDYEKTMRAMREHLSGRTESYETEYRIRAKSGKYFCYRDKGGILTRTKAGKPELITGVVMDISKEKQIERLRTAEQKKAQQKIADSENRLRQLFLSINQGVVYHDNTGQIIDANPAAEKILGLSLEQMKGIKSVDPRWKAMHEDGSDFPGEEHPAMKALETGEVVTGVIMLVYNPKTDKHTKIKIHAEPLFHKENEGGNPYMVFARFEIIK